MKKPAEWINKNPKYLRQFDKGKTKAVIPWGYLYDMMEEYAQQYHPQPLSEGEIRQKLKDLLSAYCAINFGSATKQLDGAVEFFKSSLPPQSGTLDREKVIEAIYNNCEGVWNNHGEDVADQVDVEPLADAICTLPIEDNTMPINEAVMCIKSLPTDQAIQQIKSKLTGQPETVEIDGELVVSMRGVPIEDNGDKVDAQKLMNQVAEWSDATFGEGQRNPAIVYHLKKEVVELIEAFAKGEDPLPEFADCYMLLMDSAHHAGISHRQLLDAVAAKLEVNKKRKWGEPDENGVVEHLPE